MTLHTLFDLVFGCRVIAGPFRGMHYVPESIGSVLPAKLLGSYERELWPQIRCLIAYAPDLVVNIGAGEGYYAVGIARCLEGTRVIAYESSSHGRELIRRIAALNDVGSRVDIRGRCAIDDLAATLRGVGRPVVLIDAEGAERELLDPAMVPDLIHAVILVEVHDFIAPLGELLLKRFAGTHNHLEIWSHRRTVRDLPGLTRVLAFTPWRHRAVRAMNEQRPGPMRWLWFDPRPR